MLTHQDLTDALTYTKALLGSTVVQTVAYLAYRLGVVAFTAAEAANVAPQAAHS